MHTSKQGQNHKIKVNKKYTYIFILKNDRHSHIFIDRAIIKTYVTAEQIINSY